jgi:hypothetical protein
MKQKEKFFIKKFSTILLATFLSIIFVTGWTLSAAAADEKPIKIGVVTFLSGGAAGPFGVPARNGSQCRRQSTRPLCDEGIRRSSDRAGFHR